VTSEPPLDLSELRATIDDVDRELVALLERRAQTVIDIGRHKRDTGGPIYAPHREAEVLQRALDRAQALGGRLPSRTIEAIFREIMSGSFVLERPLSIGYLGPRGSFSHQAALAQFGRSVSFVELWTIEAVFSTMRRGDIDYGLVPIENSTGGSVCETLDAFALHGGFMCVYAEAVMQIRHALLTLGELSQIERIHSKAEALAQCAGFLARRFPDAELITTASTSAAVLHVREQAGTGTVADAAIGSELAGELHSVPALLCGVEDRPDNLTRFVVLARAAAEPTGDDKSSIMFTVGDAPGALVEVLACFGAAGVNLSHIDKRPSGRENWTYTFFVDALAHHTDAPLRDALVAARAHCRELTVLGSYPRAGRIL